MTANEKLRIAIIGAGIGGLSLSIALEFLSDRPDLEIDIYEASSHISEIGAGINIWPRTWNIFKAIGLEEKLLPLLPQAPDDSTRLAFEIRKGDQPEGYHVYDMKLKGSSVRLHRADLQQALMSGLAARLHLSHRLVSYEENDMELCLMFDDGKTATCDLLIGADGIKSTVRECFLMKQGLFNSPSLNPICSGDIAYRGLVSIENLQAVFPGHRAITAPMLYTGKSKHIVTYPVSQDKMVNVVGFSTDHSTEGMAYDGPTTTSCTQEEVLSIFRNWEKEVQALFQCIQKPTKWIIRSLRPMDRYSLGRVILTGDAAHAMTPHQGAGAGQAVEDAYILASLISDELCTKDTIPRISDIYNAICQPRGNLVLEKSRVAGRLCQIEPPGFEDIVEGDAQVPLARMIGLFQEFRNSLEWAWNESAEPERARALAMLRSSEVVGTTYGT